MCGAVGANSSVIHSASLLASGWPRSPPVTFWVEPCRTLPRSPPHPAMRPGLRHPLPALPVCALAPRLATPRSSNDIARTPLESMAKPPLPKKPRAPKRVANEADNAVRQAEHARALHEYARQMERHRALMRERKKRLDAGHRPQRAHLAAAQPLATLDSHDGHSMSSAHSIETATTACDLQWQATKQWRAPPKKSVKVPLGWD